MPNYRFTTVDVFTDQRFGGNPLAVFTDANGMADGEMQSLAQKIKKRDPRRQRQLVSGAIDRQDDRYGQSRRGIGQWDLGLAF